MVLARMAQIGNENVGLHARGVDPLAEMISGGGESGGEASGGGRGRGAGGVVEVYDDAGGEVAGGGGLGVGMGDFGRKSLKK